MTKTEIAESVLNEFIEDKRTDGARFVYLADTKFEWVLDMVHAAHADFGPNDVRYLMIQECLQKLTEYDEDEWEESITEIADGLVDVYNMDRLRWLSSHLDRAAYCDEAQEEGLVAADAGMFDRIGIGQFKEYEEILYSLLSSINAKFEEEETDHAN